MLRRCFRWKRAHAGVSEPPSGRRRPRRGILFILGCSLAVTAGSLWIADPDVFWHLKVGEWIVANLAVPRLDIYSWSVQGQPWTAHQWLWEALMYLMHSFAGIHGLWFLAFASALTAGLLLRGALKERGVPEEKASAAGGIAPLMLVGWLKPWPQAGVYALFAAYLFLSLRRKWGARELLFTAALGLVWSNIHSTAVLFPLLLLAESLWALIFQKDREAKKEALRSRLAAFVVAAAATLLNPHGFGLWIYAVREGLLTGNYRENIYSWMPYVFGPNVLALAFFISIIILFMAVPPGKGKRARFCPCCRVLGSGALFPDLYALCRLEHGGAARPAAFPPGSGQLKAFGRRFACRCYCRSRHCGIAARSGNGGPQRRLPCRGGSLYQQARVGKSF